MALPIFTWSSARPYRRKETKPFVKTEFENGVVDVRTKWPYGPVEINLQQEAEDDTTMHAIYDFYIARSGGVEPFLYQDRWDKPIVGEAVGTGDTSETIFYLDKKYPINGTLKVYLAAVEQTEGVDYTVDYENGEITFTVAPGGSVAITADYEFYRKMRFKEDNINIDEFSYLLYNAGIPLTEVL